MNFSNKLKEVRIKKKLLKSQVAKLFSWTPMYYGRYENGSLVPSKSNIHKFAEFMNISIPDLEILILNEKGENNEKMGD